MVQNIFLSGIFQIYLVFISAEKCIEYFRGTIRLYSCKSSGMSEENIENITRSLDQTAVLIQLPLIIIYYQK